VLGNRSLGSAPFASFPSTDVAGTAANTIGLVQTSGTAAAIVTETASQNIAAFGSSGSSSARVTVTASNTPASFSETASATATTTAIATQAIGAFGQTAILANSIKSSATQAVDQFVSTSSSSISAKANANQIVDPFGGTSIGLNTVAGFAIQTLAPIVGSANSLTVVKTTVAQTLDPIVSSAINSVSVTVTAAQTMDAYVQSASSKTNVGGVAAQSIDAVVASGNVATLIVAQADQTVVGFTGIVGTNAFYDLFVSIDQTIAPFVNRNNSLTGEFDELLLDEDGEVIESEEYALGAVGIVPIHATVDATIDNFTSRTKAFASAEQTIGDFSSDANAIQVYLLSGNSIVPPFISAATSSEIVTVTAAQNIGSVTSNGIGVVPDLAAGASTIAPVTSVGVVNGLASLSGTSTFTNATQTASAKALASLFGPSTISPVISAAVAVETVTGTSTATFDIASNGAAKVTNNASGTNSIGLFSIDAEGTVENIHGIGTSNLGEFISNGYLFNTRNASGTSVVDEFTTASAAKVGILGSAASSFVFTQSTNVQALDVGSLSVLIEPITGTSTSRAIVGAYADQSIPQEALVAAGQTIGTVSASTQIAPFSNVTLGVVQNLGSTANQIEPFVNSATSSGLVNAIVSENIDPFATVASAQIVIVGSAANNIAPFTQTVRIDQSVDVAPALQIDPFTNVASGTTPIHSTVSQSFVIVASQGRGSVSGNAANVSQTITPFTNGGQFKLLVKAAAATNSIGLFESFTTIGNVIGGSVTHSINAITSVAEGFARVSVNVAQTVQPVLSDGHGLPIFESISGTASQTISAFTEIAVGGYPPIIGASASTISAYSSNGNLSSIAKAAATNTVGAFTSTGLLGLVASGTATVSIGALQSVTEGAVQVRATSATAFAEFASAGLSVDLVSASGAITIAPFISTTYVRASASGANTVAPFASESIARVTADGSANNTIGPVTSAAQATGANGGSANQILPTISSSGAAKARIVAYDTSRVGPFTSTTDVSGILRGTASDTIPATLSSGSVKAVIAGSAEQNSGYFNTTVIADAVATATGSSTLAVTSFASANSAARLSGANTIAPFTSAGTLERKAGAFSVAKIGPVVQNASGSALVSVTSIAAILPVTSVGRTKATVEGTANSTVPEFGSFAIPHTSVSGSGQSTIGGASQNTNLDLIVKGRAQATTFGPFTSIAISPAPIRARGQNTLHATIDAFGSVGITSTVEQLLAPFTSDGFAGPYIHGTASNIILDFAPRIVGKVSATVKAPSYPFHMATPVGQSVLLKNQYDIPAGQAVCFILQVTDDPVKLRILRMKPKFGQTYQDGSLRIWLSKLPLGTPIQDRAWRPQPEMTVFVYPDTMQVQEGPLNISIPQGDYYVNMLNMENRDNTVMVFPSPHLIAVTS
jgi:hypothetical protein